MTESEFRRIHERIMLDALHPKLDGTWLFRMKVLSFMLTPQLEYKP